MKAKKLLVVLCAAVMCLSLGILGACSHEHDWSAWKVTTAATCTEKGVETRECDCGETETRDIAALGHDWGAWTLSADGSAYTRACKRDKCTATESKAAGSAEEYPLVVSDKAALADAIKKGGYIKLSADATLTASELNAALAANRTAPAGEEDFTPAAISIDLGGKTLTVSDEIDTSVIIAGGQQVTISNGTLVANNTNAAQNASFWVGAGSSITFDGLDINVLNTLIGPDGEDAQVNIVDCVIESEKGGYIVATNAGSQENYGVDINISGSTLTAKVGMPVCMNVGGTLDISDSVINGDGQGILVRAGTANLTNVDINVTVAASYWNMFETSMKFLSNPAGWQSGNMVAYGALIVGDTNGSAYNASAIVTVNGGSINCVAADGETVPAEQLFAVYAVQLNGGDGEDAYVSEITFSGDVEISGQVINFNNTAEITGLDDSVTVLGQWNGEKFVEYQAPADEEEAA